MKIADKLAAFIQNALTPDLLIQHDEAEKFSIGQPNNLRKMLFENNVSMGSMYIQEGNRPAFMGAFSYMNGGGYIRGPVFIGRYCSIGRRVTIGAGMHSMSGVSTSPTFPARSKGSPYTAEQRSEVKQNKKSAITVIENDVWIGDGVVVLPGVRIGTGSVIGANSVVTKDVSPYTVVGGCPAKPIGDRFSERIVSALLSTEYWEASPELLAEAPGANVFEFISHFENHSPQPHAYSTMKFA